MVLEPLFLPCTVLQGTVQYSRVCSHFENYVGSFVRVERICLRGLHSGGKFSVSTAAALVMLTFLSGSMEYEHFTRNSNQAPWVHSGGATLCSFLYALVALYIQYHVYGRAVAEHVLSFFRRTYRNKSRCS